MPLIHIAFPGSDRCIAGQTTAIAIAPSDRLSDTDNLSRLVTYCEWHLNYWIMQSDLPSYLLR
ncbi:hypothetical protein [Vibrio nigripulchritudo]|uniref:hypothetical protein n=1 Tax=Vibrio nigripulchritudo TaxID=28173 RepID=UPI00190C1909|nr:hypothetical protein [Vibrio nigripulchritudo]